MIKIEAFCIFRDAEAHLPALFKRLEEVEKHYDISYWFYENDSDDKTVEILNEWLKTRSGGLISENLNAPKFGSSTSPARMAQLCYCRNKGKDQCVGLGTDDRGDISVLFDCDVDWSLDTLQNLIDCYNDKTSAAMITSNSIQNIPDWTYGNGDESYYDVYPLRDMCGNMGLYFSSNPFVRPEDIEKWWANQPVQVLSAFGGLAVIDSVSFSKVRWSSDIHCDHVNMCCELARLGEIYVLPYAKVYIDVDCSKINLAVCKQVAIGQYQLLETFRKTNAISTSTVLDVEGLKEFL